MRAKPVEQIRIPEKPGIGNFGKGVLATCISGGTSARASRHLSNHMSVTISHSNAKSSVDGISDLGVLYGTMT